MSLKEQIGKDLDLFFSVHDFAEVHTLGGIELLCIIDSEQLKQNRFKSVGGLYEGSLLIYVKEQDIAGLSVTVDSPILFDDRQYLVSEVSPIGGVLEITLRENRGY